MRRMAKIMGLLSVVLVLVFSGLLYAQRGGKPPSDSTTTIKPFALKVTFFATDDSGNPTVLRGHPGEGDVTYQDRIGGVDAHITMYRDLLFHLQCDRFPSQHIDLDFSSKSNQLIGGLDEPFEYSEGDMKTFRIATWAPQEGLHFGDMNPGDVYTNFPVGIQFWTDVDQYAWRLQYDALPRQTGFSTNSVNVSVASNANGWRLWTLTPTPSPRNLTGLLAQTLFEKYVHNRPDPGHYLDYGTWVMPFKIVFEELPH